MDETPPASLSEAAQYKYALTNSLHARPGSGSARLALLELKVEPSESISTNTLLLLSWLSPDPLKLFVLCSDNILLAIIVTSPFIVPVYLGVKAFFTCASILKETIKRPAMMRNVKNFGFEVKLLIGQCFKYQ